MDCTQALEQDRLEAYTLLAEFWQAMTRYFNQDGLEMHELLGTSLTTKIKTAIKKISPLT